MTHHTRTLRATALSIGITLPLWLGGCASQQPEAEPDPIRSGDAKAPVGMTDPRYSGFLVDYARLRPSPRHPGTLYEQSAKLASYTAFIVEPMAVLPARTARGTPVTDAEAKELARTLHEETVEAIRATHPVVTEPGPNVAVIRAAVTALAASHVDAATGQIQIGGAAVEIEILDSITRERVAAAVESDVVRDAAEPMGEDRFSDARLVFRHWASRLYLWIRDAKELATHP